MNQQSLSAFIWSVADLLRGDYKPADYGKIILPFTVLRRLDCVLAPTKAAVLEELKLREASGINPDAFLRRKSGTGFYNASPMDLKAVTGDAANVAVNLMTYLQSFSPEVRDIFERFEFHNQVDRLDKAKLLYLVAEKFAGIDLHPRAHLAAWSGILQADAYGGYNELYAAGRQPGPVLEAGCFAHARRKFFELADVEGAARKKSRGERTGTVYPIALEAVQKLDALFEIERSINGQSPAERLAARRERSAPLMDDLQNWLQTQLAKLSRNHDLAKAINYMLRRWPAFTRFFDDGRVCLSNNAAERALRCVPLGRKAWLFCGSDRGGERAAVIYTLIQTAKLNDVDPQAWLADVLARIADHPASRIDDLLPWHWQQRQAALAA